MMWSLQVYISTHDSRCILLLVIIFGHGLCYFLHRLHFGTLRLMLMHEG